jgi:PST family polysaccharide transporter
LVVGNGLGTLNTRAADFVVGRLMGARTLGIFNISLELSTLPTSELIAPINRAVYPGYARKSANRALLRQGYLDVIGLIAAIGVPLGVGMAATSPILVPLVFGRQWIEAAPLVGILAFYGILTAMHTNNHYIYLVLGKPNIPTYLQLVQMSLLFPLLLISSAHYGIIGVVYAYLATQVIFFPISFAVLKTILEVPVDGIVRVLWRPFISAAIMFGVMRLLMPMADAEHAGSLSLLIHLLSGAAVGAVVYVGGLYAIWILSFRPLGAERRLLDVVQQWLWSRIRSIFVFSR